MTLLRHTTADVKERSGLTINPAKTCQPIGAMYAALGVRNCLPHSHGSQGCCAYHRSTLTRHYKEPVMAATSSFTEGSSVFGGQSNLLQAIENIFTIYKPDIIAVHTTCLSETIGDDIPQIIAKAKEEGKIPAGKFVIHVNTPSYVGSHVVGFSGMVKSLVDYFAVATDDKRRTINIIPGWVEPSDMREIRRLTAALGVETIIFPDTSDVLDAPQTGQRQFYPDGGTPVESLRKAGDSLSTIALGLSASGAAARALDAKCKVPCDILELPIGLRATDRFIDALRRAARVHVPEALNRERGRLVDVMSDMHQYFYNKRVALWGDPDQLVALSEFLIDLDMRPVYVVTGTPGREFEARMARVLAGKISEAKVRQGSCADMFLMHQWIKEQPVDLLIGNTYGKYIARDENIPFVRHGFPIMDRVGHSYFPTVGYQGGLRLLEKILDAVLAHKDRESSEESFELVM
ncbi:MAG TPA: nitrogenase molybdenum-iron protein subunit beta [Verrucomicrobia bacterium]|nr:MAG: nitrogenase molybdenum-iron protein subunit beta [Lentisphaerae bacterium GWF2_57_35]HBA82922.1 nitrogenase molybdenum-iron protein subunit beta [Verrucomicrobiota bacterium]